MSEFKISFGVNGSEEAWYLRTGREEDFSPINIALLPGPKPVFTRVSNQTLISYTAEEFDSQLLFRDWVLADSDGGTTTFDQLPDWNSVKNVQIVSDGAQSLVLDGFVHVDAQLGLVDGGDTTLILNGTKRANVITGDGNDVIDIRMVSDQNSVWVDSFRINTGAGDDTVSLSGLDIDAELAAGDLTYLEAANKPGLDLINSGEGRNSYTALGAGNDTFSGYTSNDHIWGGTDNGAVEQVYGTKATTGFGYAVGGSTGKFGCDSILYKIDLATGKTTAVGEVKIGLGWLGSIGGLDIESLSISPKDGQLYGFASKFGILDSLVKIDPLTAKTTYVKLNLSGFRSDLQDMAFDAQGNLFFISCGDFMKVNTTTGAVQTIGNNTLNKCIGAMAINQETGKVYALADLGSKTVVYEINKANGKVLSEVKISGLDKCGSIEGMSFDANGNLIAIDKETGGVFKIDLESKSASLLFKTLTDGQQYGDGFEAFTIATSFEKVVVDLKAKGGDVITTGAGEDHVNYSAGDGVDTITDFEVGTDVLHIAGYTADQLQIDVFKGDTFIRFKDGSADGFVDNAMIELSGVDAFDPSLIVYTLSA